MTMPLDRRRWLLWAGAALGACSSVPTPLAPSPAPASAPASAFDPLRPLTRIAFGSCADQSKPQPVWRTLLADAPDLFIFGGDNVYGDAVPFSAAKLRAAYDALAAQPGFADFRARVPHLEIWDDHDYGLNDGGADFAGLAEAKAEFLRFWAVPPLDPRRTRAGLYREQRFGPPGQRVQVILLDTRSFRSPLLPTDQRGAPGKERYVPDDDPAKTMLGAAQWAWLEERLRDEADVRLIVSSIQVVADGHGWERWGNLPRERARLYELIGRTRAKGVVFASGDRHIGGVYTQRQGAPYPLWDVTSSGLTHANAGRREPGPNRVGELITANHYAELQIDWARRAIDVVFKPVQGGAELRRERIALATLQPT
jgi:alkaline phosphatase D